MWGYGCTENRNAWRILVGKPEGKRPLGRPKNRWEDNINRCIKGTSCEDREQIHLAWHRVKLRASVNTVTNCWVALKAGKTGWLIKKDYVPLVRHTPPTTNHQPQNTRNCQSPQFCHDSKYPACLAGPFSNQPCPAHTVLRAPATGPMCGHEQDDEGPLLYTRVNKNPSA